MWLSIVDLGMKMEMRSLKRVVLLRSPLQVRLLHPSHLTHQVVLSRRKRRKRSTKRKGQKGNKSWGQDLERGLESRKDSHNLDPDLDLPSKKTESSHNSNPGRGQHLKKDPGKWKDSQDLDPGHLKKKDQGKRKDIDPDLHLPGRKCEDIDPDLHLQCEDIDPDLHLQCEDIDPDLHLQCEDIDPDLHLQREDIDPDLHLPGRKCSWSPDPGQHLGRGLGSWKDGLGLDLKKDYNADS